MPGTEISALGTRRRLHALMWLGYSPAAMERYIGIDKSLIWRWARGDKVTRITAARVRRLYDQLSMTPLDPTTKNEKVSVNKTRANARRAGFHGPAAWWGLDIDDPDVEPITDGDPEEPGWVVEELAHLRDLGESATAAAAAIGHSRSSLTQIARRYKRPDLARWIDEKRERKAA
jgi:hypothetical protein